MIVIEWEAILLMLAVVVYVLVKVILEKRYISRKPVTDDCYLYAISRLKNVSIYSIFYESAEEWGFSNKKIEEDFKGYLLEGRLPYYVRDYARKHKEYVDKNYRPPSAFGGTLPPSWFA